MLKESLDNFVREKDGRKDAAKRIIVSDEAAKEDRAKAEHQTMKVVEDAQHVVVEPVLMANSSNAASAVGGGNNDNGASATDNNDDKLNTSAVAKTNNNNTTDSNTENANKPSLKQKVLSFFGKNDNNSNNSNNNNNNNNHGIKHDMHPVAHLNCDDHGGPTDPHIIDEMVFWVSLTIPFIIFIAPYIRICITAFFAQIYCTHY